MRIVIDLQACQARHAHIDAILALVQAIVDDPARRASAHELWIALHAAWPVQLAVLRARFARCLASERLVTYATPEKASPRIQALVRDNFFQALGADLVFAPGVHAGERGTGSLPCVELTALDAGCAGHAPWQTLVQLAAARARALPGAARARLAWIAPRQAHDDNAALTGDLARCYAIDHIAPDVPDDAVSTGGLPLRSTAWFEAHRAAYDRVVYHVADTPAHGPVLALLARHPGIVVLRDFALGHAVDGMEGSFVQALFDAHGYSGLAAYARDGHGATVAAWPLNRVVFDAAAGVITAGTDTLALARQWYGPRSAARWQLADPGAPGDLALRYFDAIEEIAQRSPATRYRQLLHDLASARLPSDPRDCTLIAAAGAIATNQPADRPRQLLVDISALVQTDLKTGIQRVVRSILLALIQDPPPGYRIEPVYSNNLHQCYRYARRFALDMLGVDGVTAGDDPIACQAGDIFFGLDLSLNITVNNADMLDAMRTRGVAVHFVVYDMLPVLQPHAFPYGAEQYFNAFLKTVASHADGVLCISRAVADEVSDWIVKHGAPRATLMKIGHFHLGADLGASAPSTGMPDNAGHVLASMAARASILMVGTIEPRKAHAQALAAFDLLWQRGVDVNLVIVGKLGWKVDAVAARLRAHPQLGKKLFWLPGVSDQMLGETYRLASALLAPSVGEGFGLPLIEAAQHGLPIIARGLPVFREVSGAHAYYFDGTEPALLADAVARWLDLHRQGRAPASSGMPWLTWAASAQQALDALVRDRWYRTLPEQGAGTPLSARQEHGL